MGLFDLLRRGGGYSTGIVDFGSPTRMIAERVREAGVVDLGSPTCMVAGRLRVHGIPYNLPHDLEELNRLDFQHYIFRYALRGNFAAPIENPANILDVGTGTGRWAREMAQLFPQAHVVGLDILPPHVHAAAAACGSGDPRPPNYSFIAGNILNGLPFPDAAFDFVHMRLLASAIPHGSWPFVISELIRVTRPGGWVESVEAALPTGGGPAAEQLMEWIRAISLRHGVKLGDAMDVGDMLRAARLADIATAAVQLPCGDYGDRVGKMMATNYIAGVKAVGGVIVDQGLATQEQFDRTLAQATCDLAASRYRCIFPIYIVYGQRTAQVSLLPADQSVRYDGLVRHEERERYDTSPRPLKVLSETLH